jgi:hypothetical protein
MKKLWYVWENGKTFVIRAQNYFCEEEKRKKLAWKLQTVKGLF